MSFASGANETQLEAKRPISKITKAFRGLFFLVLRIFVYSHQLTR